MVAQILLLLLSLLITGSAAVASSADLLDWHDISSNEKLDRNLEEHHRQLPELCAVTTSTTRTFYFEVSVRLEPHASTDMCSLAGQVLLGHDINLLLLDYGIGAAGADDDAIFLAGVCPRPSAASEHRTLRARRG